MKKWFGSFRVKIIFLISICSIMTLMVAVGSFYIINEAKRKLAFANDERIPLAQLTNQMASHIHAADRYFWNSIAEANPMVTIKLAGLAAEEVSYFETNLESLKKLTLEPAIEKNVKVIVMAGQSLRPIMMSLTRRQSAARRKAISLPEIP